MKVLVIIVLSFIACNNSTKTSQEKISIDTTKKNAETKQTIINPPAIIWDNQRVKIWGDTTNGKFRIDYTSQKFEPYISFNDFRITNLFNGKKAPINYNSNITARRYRTVITTAYKEEGLNFAGHYCFTYWGCGSPCQESAMVDLENGNVYDGPTASLTYDFKKNSTMMIVNPPDSTGFYDDCAYCTPEIWIWNENKKLFEQHLPDGKIENLPK